MVLKALERWVGSSPSDGVGVGSERWTWVEVQVSSAHRHISITDPELRGELETSSMQLLVRLMRTDGTASYWHCIYLYASLFPLEHFTQ